MIASQGEAECDLPRRKNSISIVVQKKKKKKKEEERMTAKPQNECYDDRHGMRLSIDDDARLGSFLSSSFKMTMIMIMIMIIAIVW